MVDLTDNVPSAIPSDETEPGLFADTCVNSGSPVDTQGSVSNASPGTHFGDYLLEQRLGSGAMGEVYAARHVETGEQVALKTLSKISATYRYRFKREFRAIADITHPNLIQLGELGVTVDGQPFLTMELLDGEPFVSWVRANVGAGQLPKLERIELALCQLIAGIHELHSNDCVHRDLKPSNVLVTTEGRVVILDFGLVSELSEPDGGVTADGQMLGTPAYMAPEQALGRPAGPAADYYAVGVMLYACLTGRLPHQGVALQLLVSKQEPLDADADAALAEVPEHLRDICIELLAPSPRLRPGGEALLARLSQGSLSQGSLNQRSLSQMSLSEERALAKVFVGRREELATLRAAYYEVLDHDEPVIVHLRGPSGQGKSALMRRARMELRDERCLVLHGRCRERENVPFKGVDAIVDALSASLRRLPAPELDRLRPRSVDALTRMFPALDDLWTDGSVHALSPRELRGVSWAALREVLEGVAKRLPLVIHIDDFQWADVDSVQLLHELLRPLRAPATLLVLGIRDDLGELEALRALDDSDVLGPSLATTLELGPLTPADACELATALVEAQGSASTTSASDVWSETIALRTQGNPFFITQLVLTADGSVASNPDLDELVAGRLGALDVHARRVLELVAVSGGPLSRTLALELCPDASEDDVDTLRELDLVVLGGSSTTDSDSLVETAHDRVREVVLGQLEADERARLRTSLGDRLLAQCGGRPCGDTLFRIVDYLNAGAGDGDALAEPRRLELARLNTQAGERALETSSYAVARAYFESAHELAEAWLAEARRGQGHHDLCVAIAFGRARTIGDTTAEERIYDELLGWALSPSDYAKILIEYILNLVSTDRPATAREVATRGMRHLRVRLPRRASLIWALSSFLLGHLALARFGYPRIATLKDAPSEAERAAMDIMALAAIVYSVSPTPLWGLGLAGRHVRLLITRGFHDLALTGLGTFTRALLVAGKVDRGVALWDAVAACEGARALSAADRVALRWVHFVFVAPSMRPIHEAAASTHDTHRYCHELGQPYAEFVFAVGSILHMDAGTPLAELTSLIETMGARAGQFRHLDMERGIKGAGELIRMLTDGPEHAQPPSLEDFGNLPNQVMFAVRNVWINVLFGEYERAWAVMQKIGRPLERVAAGFWFTPIYAALSVVVMAERWPTSSRPQRWRMRRAARKHRSTARRWASRCHENYGPMVALIDAELAMLAGDFDQAMRAYEDAQKVALGNRMLWLAGLASERLARQARRAGHTLVANAVLATARETYQSWGADALVRSIDDDEFGRSNDDDRLMRSVDDDGPSIDDDELAPGDATQSGPARLGAPL